MIADEYKKEMITGCDIDKIRKIIRIKEQEYLKSRKERLQLLVTRTITRTPE